MNTRRLVALLPFTLCSVSSVRAETLEWIRQLGTIAPEDLSAGVSADGLGSVYISGRTQGSLEGSNAGGTDAFLAKYDASGTLEWTQQLGTSSDENAIGVSADGLGNVYISGGTHGSLGGPTPVARMRFSASTTPTARSSGLSSSAPATQT